MVKHWYVYIVIAIVADILLWVCDRHEFIKPKSLRYFIVIFASALICWCIYDLVFDPQ